MRHLASASYLCEHCRTNFHWVDPTNITVAHKPGVCVCGRVATAFCVRCHDPLCEKHKVTWSGFSPDFSSRALYKRLRDSLRRAGKRCDSKYELCDSSFYFFSDLIDGDLPEPQSVRQVAEKLAIPQHSDAVLCQKCLCELHGPLRVAWESVHQAVVKGRACGGCFTEHVQGQCAVCGVGLCSQHGVVCGRCRQLLCRKHAVDGRLCIKCNQSSWLDKLWQWVRPGK